MRGSERLCLCPGRGSCTSSETAWTMGEDGRVENGLARGSWRTPDASDTDVCAVLGSYNTVNLAEGTHSSVESTHLRSHIFL